MVSPYILAHRGFTKSAPENSIAAMLAAVEAGFDGIECDVQVTGDHVPCIHHDEKINRMTEASGRISEMSWAEVEDKSLKGSSECIPSLRALLDVTRVFTLVNLEIKCGLEQCPDVFELLAEELKAHPDRVDQWVLTSFDHAVVAACAEKLPAVRRGLLIEKRTRNFMQEASACSANIILPHVSALDNAMAIANAEGQNPYAWWTWSAATPAKLEACRKNDRLEAVISDCAPR